MKNKKLLKAIASLAVGTVMAAGSLSLAACGGGGHKHVYNANAWEKDASTHWNVCTADGCDAKDNKVNEAAHSMQDGECTVCHYKTTTTPENPDPTTPDPTDPDPTDPDPTDPDPVTKENVLFNPDTDITANTTDGQQLAAGIKSVGALTRSSSTRTVSYPGLGTDGKLVVGNRIQFSKNLGSEPNGLEITPEENATLIVYASGSNADTEGFLALYEASDSKIGEPMSNTKLSIGKGGTTDIGTVMYQLEKDTTYYLARAEAKTVNIFLVALCYNPVNEIKTEVPETPATCEEAGNAKYYTTNYGRYLAADGTTHKVAHEVVDTLPALGHSYTFEVTQTPDETTPGSATLTCGRDSAHNKTVPLPVLSSNEYTTRPNAGESGTYTFVYEKTNITFTAIGVGAATLTYTTVYGNTFATAGDVVYGADAATSSVGTSGTATAKIYGSVTGRNDQASANSFTNANKVTIADNKLKTVDTTTDITTDAYIILDSALSTGVLKISGKITLTANNSSWTPFQLLNGDKEEFLGFRTTASGKMGYRVDGGSATGDAAFTSNTEFAFEVIIDFTKETPTAVITINGNEFEKINLGSKASGFGGIRLTTSNNANRNIYLGDLVVATQD